MRLLKSYLRHPWRWTRVLLFPDSVGVGDRRWHDIRNFNHAWDDRTRMIAKMIGGESSVLEFGCGRGALLAMLRPSVTYVGSDVVARDEKTLVWNLNDGAPPLEREFGVIVFSGVLEYVKDVKRLVAELAGSTNRIVCSYASQEDVPDPLTRRESGWVNSLSAEEFCACFRSVGFKAETSESWRASRVYDFRKQAEKANDS